MIGAHRLPHRLLEGGVARGRSSSLAPGLGGGELGTGSLDLKRRALYRELLPILSSTVSGGEEAKL